MTSRVTAWRRRRLGNKLINQWSFDNDLSITSTNDEYLPLTKFGLIS